jgi:hypothetical protein
LDQKAPAQALAQQSAQKNLHPLCRNPMPLQQLLPLPLLLVCQLETQSATPPAAEDEPVSAQLLLPEVAVLLLLLPVLQLLALQVRALAMQPAQSAAPQILRLLLASHHLLP